MERCCESSSVSLPVMVIRVSGMHYLRLSSKSMGVAMSLPVVRNSVHLCLRCRQTAE